jgi:parallel beta-helix repeat protein
VDSGQAGATVKSSTPYAVSVNPGGDGALIQGLVILSPITVGILVRGAKASVRACKVTDAKPDASGQFGLGVLASEGADATIDHNSISGSAQVGVLVDGSVGSVTNNSVGGNLAGGVAVQHTSSMVEVRANVLDANVRAGVLVFGATARIADNTISNTAADPVTMIGDGVIVRSSDDASPTMSNVEVSGNTVSGNARVGVLCAIGCSGSVVKNQISHNGFQSQFAAGLWLQTGAGGTDGLQITGNTVTGNKYVGIGLTSGARGLLQQNVAINDTQAGSVVTPGGGSAMIGDGIGIFAKAAAALSGNTISGNSRFGVVLDDPTAGTTSLTSNTIAGSGNIGVVVQNTSATIDLTTNAFNGNASGDSKVVTKADVPFVVKKDDFPAK